MRTRVRPYDKTILPYINRESNELVKLISFKRSTDYFVLRLNVKNIDVKNYRLFIKGKCLTVVISEMHQYSKPTYIQNFSWYDFNKESYEILKSVDVWLPGDNFYMMRHFVYPYEELLELMLGVKNKNVLNS